MKQAEQVVCNPLVRCELDILQLAGVVVKRGGRIAGSLSHHSWKPRGRPAPSFQARPAGVLLAHRHCGIPRNFLGKELSPDVYQQQLTDRLAFGVRLLRLSVPRLPFQSMIDRTLKR
jgi:hypothetical protein